MQEQELQRSELALDSIMGREVGRSRIGSISVVILSVSAAAVLAGFSWNAWREAGRAYAGFTDAADAGDLAEYRRFANEVSRGERIALAAGAGAAACLVPGAVFTMRLVREKRGETTLSRGMPALGLSMTAAF